MLGFVRVRKVSHARIRLKKAMKTMKYFCILILLIVGTNGCSKQDSDSKQNSNSKHDADFIPYDLKGLNVWLFDAQKAPNGDCFAGHLESSYQKREEGLSSARALAFREADRLHFDMSNGRYYIICTLPSNSSCVTKVR